MGKHIHKLSNLNRESLTGDCASCGEGIRVQPREGGKRFSCYVAWREQKGHNRTYSYVSSKTRLLLLAEQGPNCKICNEKMAQANYDHDHSTGEFRGFLCRMCNLGLGHFKDDPSLLRKAIDYLG